MDADKNELFHSGYYKGGKEWLTPSPLAVAAWRKLLIHPQNSAAVAGLANCPRVVCLTAAPLGG